MSASSRVRICKVLGTEPGIHSYQGPALRCSAPDHAPDQIVQHRSTHDAVYQPSDSAARQSAAQQPYARVLCIAAKQSPRSYRPNLLRRTQGQQGYVQQTKSGIFFYVDLLDLFTASETMKLVPKFLSKAVSKASAFRCGVENFEMSGALPCRHRS